MSRAAFVGIAPAVRGIRGALSTHAPLVADALVAAGTLAARAALVCRAFTTRTLDSFRTPVAPRTLLSRGLS